MITNDFGLDFERIRHAITYKYPRAADMPGPGFAAGPCLFKDTMQIAAFNENRFTLGHSAMMINEGLPLYVVSQIQRQHDLSTMCVGILGMAFKGGSDDVRSSLSYKLKRVLRIKAQRVLCTDPYVMDDLELEPLGRVLSEADLVIIATPHPEYKGTPAYKAHGRSLQHSGEGRADLMARVSVVVPVFNEGARSSISWTGCSRLSPCPVRS